MHDMGGVPRYEALPEEDYLRLTYYQRWLLSITATLLQKGVFSAAELAQAVREVA